MTSKGWLTDFATSAGRTDQLVGNDDHTALLAAGLLGEMGSILAEMKKEEREREAYPSSSYGNPLEARCTRHPFDQLKRWRRRGLTLRQVARPSDSKVGSKKGLCNPP